MRIKLIAFDSMGVRSMATFVETSEGTFLIDPGAALAPRRYGLPPHEEELKVLREKLNAIYDYVKESDYLIISHYHRDHYPYRFGEEEYYAGKNLFIKHPQAFINPSQRIRAYVLLEKMNVKTRAKSIVYADSASIKIGRVSLEFSPPLSHGQCGTGLGWVLATSVIEDGLTLIHASDIQGCLCQDSLNHLMSKKPDFLIMSGPPTYLGEAQEGFTNLEKLLKNIVHNTVLILDHHLLRDLYYRRYFEKLEKLNMKVKITTAAEFMGEEVRLLEANRKNLWESLNRE
uniref:UPF0282 protein ENP55_05790 n=1 Tax=Thermosphaera aggregans TaxID=54254 RepID=A0A7C2BLB9_9CREN